MEVSVRSGTTSLMPRRVGALIVALRSIAQQHVTSLGEIEQQGRVPAGARARAILALAVLTQVKIQAQQVEVERERENIIVKRERRVERPKPMFYNKTECNKHVAKAI